MSWTRSWMTGALTVAVIGVSVVGCGASLPRGRAHHNVGGSTSTATPKTTSHTAVARDWLGLDYNSAATPIAEFSRLGIVFDRLGSFDLLAGQTVRNKPQLARGLRLSIAAGMIPDVVINPAIGPTGCTMNPQGTQRCLPVDAHDVGAFIRGFVATVRSIRRTAPRVPIAFEPMNEPWTWGAPGEQSGLSATARYSGVLAKLLPAVKAAGIPLSVIYVPVTGVLADGSRWLQDLYRAQPCLKPGHGTCGPVEGWNFHAYGPPDSSSTGISAVGTLRDSMQSGDNNIIVSELGFCATDVLGGAQCDENTPTVDGTSTKTAAWLGQALQTARRMHQAGWLRALIVWQRTGGGWSMQLPNGALTAEGRELVGFARSLRH